MSVANRGDRARSAVRGQTSSLPTLPRYLWALAAGLALGLLAVLVSRWLGTPVVGWTILLAFLVLAYVRARRNARRR